MSRRAACALVAVLAYGLPLPSAMAGPFDDWAAMVVAGDWRARSGAASEVFDNARRELAMALERIGFAPNHIQQYSARPDLDPDVKPFSSDRREIEAQFRMLTAVATGGCFVYLTSHGAPLGIMIGGNLVGIRQIGDIVDGACPGRPTVIVVSACYSGMFIPVLRAENRMILTASRADRTSFGCGEDNQYTYFDQCVLESLPIAPDFPGLAREAQGCVAMRERSEGIIPASEPQLYLGAAVTGTLPAFDDSTN